MSRQTFDVLEVGDDDALLQGLPELPDIAVCLVGLLGDQAESERNVAAAPRVFATNFTGPARLLGALANAFEPRGSGTIVGIGSVAGDRGRGSKCVYSAANRGWRRSCRVCAHVCRERAYMSSLSSPVSRGLE